jgi:hypothetical protein
VCAGGERRELGTGVEFVEQGGELRMGAAGGGRGRECDAFAGCVTRVKPRRCRPAERSCGGFNPILWRNFSEMRSLLLVDQGNELPGGFQIRAAPEGRLSPTVRPAYRSRRSGQS